MERRLRDRPIADQVKLLRVLKPIPAAVCGAPRPCWDMVNGNCSAGGNVHRGWAQGPDATAHPAGRQAQVSDEAWAALAAELQAGRAVHPKDGQPCPHERRVIDYRSLNRVSRLFIRRKTKPKTGRP
jgi:hypothetical protein